MKVVWKSATTMSGELSVMIFLTGEIVLLFVDNLGLAMQVRHNDLS